jgi:hypothetical protein
MTEVRGRPGNNAGAATHTAAQSCNAKPNTAGRQQRLVSSQQVSWWSVREYVRPVLLRAGSWPMVGTPEWCGLADDDPRKIAAVFDAASHWALRVELCQEAQCQASQAISADADWAAIAQHISNHNEFYAQQPWLKRVIA